MLEDVCQDSLVYTLLIHSLKILWLETSQPSAWGTDLLVYIMEHFVRLGKIWLLNAYFVKNNNHIFSISRLVQQSQTWFSADPLIHKICLLILLSNCYPFPCQWVLRIWCWIKITTSTWWVWVFLLPACWIMWGIL